MAVIRAGRSTAAALSSVSLQLLLYLSAIYSLSYFLSTLGMIVYKRLALSYPDGSLVVDVCLLLLMAVLEVLRLYWGLRSASGHHRWCRAAGPLWAGWHPGAHHTGPIYECLHMRDLRLPSAPEPTDHLLWIYETESGSFTVYQEVMDPRLGWDTDCTEQKHKFVVT